MKKIKAIQLISVSLFFIYLTLFVSDLIWRYTRDDRQLLFSLVLVCLSISTLIKGVFLKSQSTLWFSITLVLYAILMVVFGLLKVDYSTYYYLYVLLPIIASIINIVVFGNLLYIKLIILNISIFIPIVIAEFVILSIFDCVILSAISIALGIIVCKCVKMGKEKV